MRWLAVVQRSTSCESQLERSFAAEWSTGKAHFRGVRVHLSTGYIFVQRGLRRALRNGRVSSSPARKPANDSPLSHLAVWHPCGCAGGPLAALLYRGGGHHVLHRGRRMRAHQRGRVAGRPAQLDARRHLHRVRAHPAFGALTPPPPSLERERERERVELVGSHGRWKRPCLQTAHMTL
jgi:hypothetical protein